MNLREQWGSDERVEYDAPLGPRTTYRVGGSVRALVTLRNDDDVAFWSTRVWECGYDVVVIGNGSNLLVADGMHDVIALALVGTFNDISWHDDATGAVEVRAGAAVDLPVAARRLSAAGVSGFEWAVGVPGTFGGAVVMNAGGHGSTMAAAVSEVESWTPDGRRLITPGQLGFGYRSSALTSFDIVTRVTLRLAHGDAATANERVREIVRWRREHQPGGANAGSVFRNPDGVSAGQLIEECGLKGHRIGTAMISDKHANFIIADADGRANDIIALMRHVQAVVWSTTQTWLIPEHHFVGLEEGL